MPNQNPYFLYRLENAHPGVLGETMLVVTVNLNAGERFIGEYRLLTAADGGRIEIGQFTFDASLTDKLNIEDPVEFCKDETVKFAYSEIAGRLLAAEGRYGAASVFAHPCSFVEATTGELLSLYLRGELKGKWSFVKKDCASRELVALVSIWESINPLRREALNGG